MDKGPSILLGILIIIFLVFVTLVTPKSPSGYAVPGSISAPKAGSVKGGTTISSPTNASRQYTLSISPGNAAYEKEAYKEYVTLENWGNSSVDITGWTLKNGLDQRSFAVGGELQRYSADIATIPRTNTGDVVLKPGERAVITTGTEPIQYPYPVTSFKENMCTGYFGRLSDYTFEPSLTQNCVRPANEPGVANLDTQCRLFIRGLSPCGTPKFDKNDSHGQPCATCVNGREISQPCADFVKAHFSYRGCLAYHSSDANFNNGNTWRIYLGRAWEMWDQNYESMELFDRTGTLQASQNY